MPEMDADAQRALGEQLFDLWLRRSRPSFGPFMVRTWPLTPATLGAFDELKEKVSEFKPHIVLPDRPRSSPARPGPLRLRESGWHCRSRLLGIAAPIPVGKRSRVRLCERLPVGPGPAGGFELYLPEPGGAGVPLNDVRAFAGSWQDRAFAYQRTSDPRSLSGSSAVSWGGSRLSPQERKDAHKAAGDFLVEMGSTRPAERAWALLGGLFDGSAVPVLAGGGV